MLELAKKEDFQKGYTAHKNTRQDFDAYYKELRDHFYPRAGRFDNDKPNEVKKRYGNLLDTSPAIARRTMASGMMAGITSPARPWFRLGTPDPGLMEFAPVKEWLHFVERLMREVFNRSNLYNVLPMIYGEVGTFGTGVMAAFPDFNNVIRFMPFTVGQYYLGQNEMGTVDTFYRTFQMTVRQAVELANRMGGQVSKETQTKYDNGDYHQWIKVVHAVLPNQHHKAKSPWAKDKRFIAVYWEENSADRVMCQTGYDQFPILAPRWEVGDGDVYGTDCPGMMALPDAKQLQTQRRRMAKAVAAMASPPTQSPAGQGKKVQYNILPGTHSTYDPSQPEGIKTIYQTNPRVQELLLDIQETKQRVDTSFFADLFMQLTLSDRRQITAREIEERHEEKLLMLGPVLERLHTDMLDPLIDLTFRYMMEGGLLEQAPPPRELQGVDLKVEYISVLAQAQHAAGMGALERQVQFTGMLAQASGDATVWDKVDKDQMVDEAGLMLGVSPKTIKTDDQVAAERAQRAQQQAQMQAVAAAQQMAATAKDASQAAKTQQEVSNG